MLLVLFLCAQSCPTSWTVARQTPLSMGLSRQEYWSVLPFSSLGIFLTQGSNPCLLSPALQVDSLPTEPLHNSMEPSYVLKIVRKEEDTSEFYQSQIEEVDF